jgi:hypothetical protein
LLPVAVAVAVAVTLVRMLVVMGGLAELLLVLLEVMQRVGP